MQQPRAPLRSHLSVRTFSPSPRHREWASPSHPRTAPPISRRTYNIRSSGCPRRSRPAAARTKSPFELNVFIHPQLRDRHRFERPARSRSKATQRSPAPSAREPGLSCAESLNLRPQFGACPLSEDLNLRPQFGACPLSETLRGSSLGAPEITGLRLRLHLLLEVEVVQVVAQHVQIAADALGEHLERHDRAQRVDIA